MNERKLKKVPLADENPFCDAPVVEIAVLLESSLLPVLEAAAVDQGRSAGALIRRLIRDFLDCSESDPPDVCDTVDAPRPRGAIV
ncbi:MAG TPA: hypothetical protein VMG10_35290 [Gemmataceae bacterium]|nr:hypothetical protein [Gemmataceae bacterium]